MHVNLYKALSVPGQEDASALLGFGRRWSLRRLERGRFVVGARKSGET